MKKSFIFQLALVGASLLILLYILFSPRETKVLPTKVTVPFSEEDVRTFVSKDASPSKARKKKQDDAADEDPEPGEPDQGVGPGAETEYNAPAETVYNAPAAETPAAETPQG